MVLLPHVLLLLVDMRALSLSPVWGVLVFLWIFLFFQIVTNINGTHTIFALESLRTFILPLLLLLGFVSFVLFSKQGKHFLFTTLLWGAITTAYLIICFVLGNLALYPLLSILLGSFITLLFLEKKVNLELLSIPTLAFFIIGFFVKLPLDTLFMGFTGGVALTYLFYQFEQRYKIVFEISRVFTHEIEYRRQAAHLLFGVALATLVGFHILSAFTLGIILVVGFACITYIKSGGSIPLFHKVLLVFERQHHFDKFPGRGIFFFVMGSFFSTLLYSTEIAVASILILAFGDSITNIVGKFYGKYPLWFNKKKNIEGPIVAALLAGLAACVAVPWPHAFIAAAVAMFVETLPLQYKGYEIDDNVTIPLVAGLVLTALSYF